MNVFVLMALASWFVPEVQSLFPDNFCRDPNYTGLV